MRPDRQQLISALFTEYIEMYAARDYGLTERFSETFNGFFGGGDTIIKDKAAWVDVTRQDFAEVPDRIGIEMLDLSLLDLSDDVTLATAFFHIHLPFADAILSKETARLVLVFRREGESWKISHSSISAPYRLVQDGEIFPLRNLYERNRELEGMVEERTRELEQSNAKLEALSNTDALTEIANRRRFDAVLTQEWNRALRSGAPLALIMLDVDHFKHYNDLYGHLAGDACLKALAQALVKAERRAGHFVARYGGEEFVALLPNTSLEVGLESARRIQQEIWALALPHENTPPAIVTVSLGVASLSPGMLQQPEDLVRQADKALYRAKKQGRNCVLAAGQ